jgi:membrane dipeptidase
MQQIFDGHNDVLLRLYERGGKDAVQSFLNGEIINGKPAGQLDLPRARQAGFAGGFFAIYVPSHEHGNFDALMQSPPYNIPLPAPCALDYAQHVTFAQASLLIRMEAVSQGALKICRNTADIQHCLATNTIAAIMHIEGAEAIDRDLDALYVLHQAGLRSLGPVWSRPNIFGNGVPFKFPSTPDTGDGLTEAGFDLVRACNKLKIMIDVSHLNEKGFWDVAKTSHAPLVATHSNAYALSNHSRNLTDRQLDAIKDTGGMVGVNYAVAFLRDDGRKDANTPIDTMIRHMDYLVERLGEDNVGLGSDFDGATIPKELDTVNGLPKLVEVMRLNGYGKKVIHNICCQNWINLLEKTWS